MTSTHDSFRPFPQVRPSHDEAKELKKEATQVLFKTFLSLHIIMSHWSKHSKGKSQSENDNESKMPWPSTKAER